MYIDDIIIKTETFAEHIEYSKGVIAHLNKVGMMINLEKSKFL